MNISSFIFEQALRRLQVPERSIRQFLLAASLSEVEGVGFPKELLHVSAPVIMRGVLNFAVLQMHDDWIYPYWVHKQLDPNSESFVARSQNPLLINITHRNWTAVGTPFGSHEAVIDPRGLATPLPREWSIDLWLADEHGAFFPSRAATAAQEFGRALPSVTTHVDHGDLQLRSTYFACGLRGGHDVLFGSAQLRNMGRTRARGLLCVAVRPFNPEGVAPLHTVTFETPRVLQVDGVTGVVFARAPDWMHCGSLESGDISQRLLREGPALAETPQSLAARCDRGRAHAVAAYRFDLEHNETASVDYSVALAEDRDLVGKPARRTWRVSFDKRLAEQCARWEKELAIGAVWHFPDEALQRLFDACRLTLLQFHDGDFVSPGPWLYHHFWFRDACTMLRALDALGYHHRVRQALDAFPARLTREGFFRGPDGEWDSNGTVLWTLLHHYQRTASRAWLAQQFPTMARAARWLARKRQAGANGLLPPSLSAEHFGLTDQYYWDNFWALAGLRATAEAATELGDDASAHRFLSNAADFEDALQQAIISDETRLGHPLIPAAPGRAFDAGAIGSLVCVYPLDCHTAFREAALGSVRALRDRFVDTRGFYHPIIHSGYNPYLTMQIAHAQLALGDIAEAWETAECVFRQAIPPYSFPEAIHPRSGGGAMGDGHHGWAAAEIALFLRDCLIDDNGTRLVLFRGAGPRLLQPGRALSFQRVPTRFGPVSASLIYTDARRAILEIDCVFKHSVMPESIDVHLPFCIQRATPVSDAPAIAIIAEQSISILRLRPEFGTFLLDF
jgi:hypothetical protein